MKNNSYHVFIQAFCLITFIKLATIATTTLAQEISIRSTTTLQYEFQNAGNESYLSIYLRNDLNQGVPKQKVSITRIPTTKLAEPKTDTAQTDEQGHIQYKTNWTEKEYQIYISYDGAEYYSASEKTFNIEISKKNAHFHWSPNDTIWIRTNSLDAITLSTEYSPFTPLISLTMPNEKPRIISDKNWILTNNLRTKRVRIPPHIQPGIYEITAQILNTGIFHPQNYNTTAIVYDSIQLHPQKYEDDYFHAILKISPPIDFYKEIPIDIEFLSKKSQKNNKTFTIQVKNQTTHILLPTKELAYDTYDVALVAHTPSKRATLTPRLTYKHKFQGLPTPLCTLLAVLIGIGLLLLSRKFIIHAISAFQKRRIIKTSPQNASFFATDDNKFDLSITALFFQLIDQNTHTPINGRIIINSDNKEQLFIQTLSTNPTSCPLQYFRNKNNTTFSGSICLHAPGYIEQNISINDILKLNAVNITFPLIKIRDYAAECFESLTRCFLPFSHFGKITPLQLQKKTLSQTIPILKTAKKKQDINNCIQNLTPLFEIIFFGSPAPSMENAKKLEKYLLELKNLLK